MTIDTLADIVRYHATISPEQIAMFYSGTGHNSESRSWTFSELDLESNRVACALQEIGIGAGDRIAYLDKNSPEYFTYLYGGAKVNAVNVSVNWRLAAKEMEYILNNSESKILLIGEEFLTHLEQMKLHTIEKIVIIKGPGNHYFQNSSYSSYEQWIGTQRSEDPLVNSGPQDTCYQLYTSGTTGLPKGVELTNDNFLGLLKEGLDNLKMSTSSVNLVCMPLFHIAGSGWGVCGQFHGAKTVLLREVDLDEILEIIPQQKITHTVFVPAVLQSLLGVPGVEDTDFSSVELILYGASPITEEVLVNAMELFACEFVQAYGLTETTGGCVMLESQDHDPGGPRAHLLRSCGKAAPGTELKIVDSESLVELAEGEVGEILIRGRQVMKGYWANPQANEAALLEDGWLRSGDAGYMIEGYLYIHDRIKDMIISGAENIYPAEIENLLMSHADISDAAVIGIPSERWGESVLAIITRANDSLSEGQVIDFCHENIAGYKSPSRVVWMEEIPRNPSGKILKTELRAPYWKGKDRQVG